MTVKCHQFRDYFLREISSSCVPRKIEDFQRRWQPNQVNIMPENALIIVHYHILTFTQLIMYSLGVPYQFYAANHFDY